MENARERGRVARAVGEIPGAAEGGEGDAIEIKRKCESTCRHDLAFIHSYTRVKLNFNPSSRPTRGAQPTTYEGKKENGTLLFAGWHSRARKLAACWRFAQSLYVSFGYFAPVKSAYGPLGIPQCRIPIDGNTAVRPPFVQHVVVSNLPPRSYKHADK
ncbi:hypothetical protein PUN28_007002 [Cardiocondyla obscurior]|uniref:Uncharacterized protein n=1 Tax=Cardiocondyla obscurior TaxID=286306 RepID=A0AAW2G135_9HYME